MEKNEPLKGKAQECLVEFDGELVRCREFRFVDVRSAVRGLLEEIENLKDWDAVYQDYVISLEDIKKLIKKWFSDVLEGDEND